MKEIKFRAWVNEKLEYDIIWPYIEDVPLQEFFNDERFKLMQYTGLKDKNGKEIYEGDILKLVYSLDMGQWTKYGDTIIQVKWSDFQCGFYPFVNFKDIEQTEVIGNIYESPELLLEEK